MNKITKTAIFGVYSGALVYGGYRLCRFGMRLVFDEFSEDTLDRMSEDLTRIRVAHKEKAIEKIRNQINKIKEEK